MKFLICIMAASIVLSSSPFSYAGEVVEEEEEKKGSGNEALTGAVMGGLLGAGLGAAIGSASGKAGQGAAIGAGVGAVGGTLVGASQASKKADESSYQDPKSSKGVKVKKRIIRQYDKEGNVVSEKEVVN